MDNETYEQLTLSADFLEGQSGYLLPNLEVQINFHNGRAIGIQLPTSVVLEVVDTEPGIRTRPRPTPSSRPRWTPESRCRFPAS